jgi:protein-tyrosine phosphatase
MKVCFPDGTVVTACSLAERRESNPKRDFGLYLDAAWRPTWDAHVVEWPDFGVPEDPVAAARAIAAAFKRAKGKERLEIGCVGGLGRTGTVLACMALLAGVPMNDAVGWVRANYDGEAIEGPTQERWVRWFADRVKTGEIQE